MDLEWRRESLVCLACIAEERFFSATCARRKEMVNDERV